MDRSGGRRRIVGRIGIGVALFGVAYGAVLVVLALVGSQVGAPGQPLFDHLPRVMSGQSAHVQTRPNRSTNDEAKPARRTDTDSSITSSPTAGPDSGQPRPESPTPTSAPSPSSSPSSSPTGAGSTTSSTAGPSPSASPTATSQGKSDQAPGASHRPTNKPGHPTHP
ncbi:MAG: hypothetical protein J2P23_00245 [Microlunatus sp.]|nr:hypothetical protein [Microlunatus sp.]